MCSLGNHGWGKFGEEALEVLGGFCLDVGSSIVGQLGPDLAHKLASEVIEGDRELSCSIQGRLNPADGLPERTAAVADGQTRQARHRILDESLVLGLDDKIAIVLEVTCLDPDLAVETNPVESSGIFYIVWEELQKP